MDHAALQALMLSALTAQGGGIHPMTVTWEPGT